MIDFLFPCCHETSMLPVSFVIKINQKLIPNISHNIFHYWVKHSQHAISISQHQSNIFSAIQMYNRKLVQTFSHDIFQYWDKHSQNINRIFPK